MSHHRARATLAIAGVLGVLPACASTSTRGDYESVQALVAHRAELPLELELVEREPQRAEPPEREVTTLLAQPLTADSAVRIALLNNRELRAQLRELGVARGEIVQAGAQRNPEFEVGVRFPEQQVGDHQDPQWDLGVAFDLTHAILTPQRKGVAEAELEATRIRLAGEVLDLSYRVRLAFYEQQARSQRLELQQTTLSALSASYEAARELHAAGNLTALDLATEHAAYEQARISIAEAEADLVDTRERLNVLLGLSGSATTWEIAVRLADPGERTSERPGLEAKAIESSLELAQARAELTAQARRAGLTQATGAMPDLQLGVHAEHDGEAWEIGPVVSGTLPVFDQQRGALLARESELWALRERYVATAVSVRAAIRAGRNRLRSAEERARQYREVILPLRERVVAETLLQYNAMQVGVFQLLQARRDQVAAAAAYIETLREYWQAHAALDQLLSGRLTGTMEQVANAPARASVASGRTGDGH